MEDLIRQITEKFDIDADKAEGIVGTVADFAKDKLPEPIAGQVSKLLGGSEGGGESSDAGGGLLDQAKGLFGGD